MMSSDSDRGQESGGNAFHETLREAKIMESAKDADQVWVTCMKCNQSYQMGWMQYGAELEEKSKTNPSAAPWGLPMKCQKCGQEGVLRAHQCEQCGVVFPLGSVPKDFLDRCPQCKYSRTEAIRRARST
jgi:predicted Zn-ribbon and HTH transcriptional regulator